jgi:hypothetical protein
LPQVLRIGAQHDDFVGGDARGNDQAVEIVVFDLAAEDAREGVLEDVVQRFDFHVRAGQRGLDAEVVHGDRRHAKRA